MMPLRIIEAIRKEHDKIVAIRVNENGYRSELSLNKAYNYQIEIYNEVQKGKKDRSQLPVYVIWTDKEFGYFVFRIDKVGDEYNLAPITEKTDEALKKLPTF